MNAWIWKSNQNKWKYVERSIFCKFAGFRLRLYCQRAHLPVFRKGKDCTLPSFLWVCRVTTIRNNFAWLLLYISLHKRKTVAQKTIACLRSTIQKLDKLWNVYKVYNKDTRASSIYVILVSLLLALNIFHTMFWCFYYWLWVLSLVFINR